MDTEKKFELFSKLKEEFFAATGLDSYGNGKIKFEINDDYNDEKQLYVDVEISWRENKKIYVRLRIDLNEKKEVNLYEDNWEEWESFDHTVSDLWRVMFFEALDI